MRKKKKGAFAFGLKIFSSCATIRKEVSQSMLSRFGIRSMGLKFYQKIKRQEARRNIQ
jgi:hypothetical protein